ncbi:hypothetical protein HMPREF1991_00464 [Hoylesella loescheii DSM 19665 = JCM 12249 = ATCC 15930]|uniref:Uncharacterized protein n=1 Tax=Hoylesella loescheii DSM 19665 = JCM 12249 = ATCC 15930 TaxID=1122985 RepID=A0A069QKV0_HOYLO|nr:hypothetical protein HMPREF1991_00464 [Hoylesella loescheii DSM 19665 = JCM 12249 = ATCC 15930]
MPSKGILDVTGRMGFLPMEEALKACIPCLNWLHNIVNKST